uniref:Small auxin up regulated protein n=1 Tax=Boehmeria nivea TaxID=83906 RepID=A0A172J226_BOENI|nr:small auxin up regulated protein [Boehmeria nivea]
MGSGEKTSLRNFHLHLPHLHHHHHHHHGGGGKKQAVIRDVPKGCLAVMVGQQGGDQKRFVVPVMYFNHPLFMQLLKEAEEEYGFDQKGTITIPCHVEEFRYVQGLIDRERSLHHHHHSHSHGHGHVHVGCFRV